LVILQEPPVIDTGLNGGCDVAIERDGSPPPGDRAPGEACAETAHHELVAATDAARAQGFVERDRNAAGARVTVTVEVQDNAFPGDAEGVDRGVEDANIGLVASS
jgi:hypothetical protein